MHQLLRNLCPKISGFHSKHHHRKSHAASKGFICHGWRMRAQITRCIWAVWSISSQFASAIQTACRVHTAKLRPWSVYSRYCKLPFLTASLRWLHCTSATRRYWASANEIFPLSNQYNLILPTAYMPSLIPNEENCLLYLARDHG